MSVTRTEQTKWAEPGWMRRWHTGITVCTFGTRALEAFMGVYTTSRDGTSTAGV